MSYRLLKRGRTLFLHTFHESARIPALAFSVAKIVTCLLKASLIESGSVDVVLIAALGIKEERAMRTRLGKFDWDASMEEASHEIATPTSLGAWKVRACLLYTSPSPRD